MLGQQPFVGIQASQFLAGDGLCGNCKKRQPEEARRDPELRRMCQEYPPRERINVMIGREIYKDMTKF